LKERNERKIQRKKVSFVTSADEKIIGSKIKCTYSCGREKVEEMSVDKKKMRNELFIDHEK
jgi:hypothetical protein